MKDSGVKINKVVLVSSKATSVPTKESLLTFSKKGMAKKLSKMEINTSDIIIKVNHMGKEAIFGNLVLNMKARLNQETDQDLEFLFMLMGQYIKDIFKMTSNTEKEFKSIYQKKNSKGSFKMVLKFQENLIIFKIIKLSSLSTDYLIQFFLLYC